VENKTPLSRRGREISDTIVSVAPLSKRHCLGWELKLKARMVKSQIINEVTNSAFMQIRAEFFQGTLPID
jgi:DNA mismatch repair protein MutH